MADQEQKSPLFVREATGLVRNVGPWSGLAFNVIWTGNAVGLTAAFIISAYVFVSPGLNITGLILLATLLSILNAAVYMFFSLAIPRSGGDYTFISRTLHPSIGFISALNWALWLPLVLGWTGANIVPIALKSLLTSYGVATSNQGLVSFASSMFTPNTTFLIGAIFIIVFTLITLLGNRVYFGFQKIAFVFMILAMAITIGVFAVNTPATFATTIDKIFGSGTYQSTISTFTSNGGYTPRLTSTAVLSGIVLWAGINTWSMGTSLLGGEMKNAGKVRTWMISNILGALSVGLLFALTTYLYLSSVGQNFVYAASYLSGTSSYNLVFPAYYSSFVVIAAPNIILFVVFAIGFFLGGMFYMPQNQILASRVMLALSFDRLVPRKLGEVSDRFHVPVNGTILALVISLASLAVYVYTSWLGFFSQLFAVAFSFFTTSIAAIVFPYRRKNVFESSPANKKLLGVPIMSLLGIANAIFMAAFIYENFTDSVLGSNSIQSVSLIIGFLIVAFIAYWVVRGIRRSQGMQIDSLFREIPPE